MAASSRLGIVSALALLAVLVLWLRPFAADPGAALLEPGLTADGPTAADADRGEPHPVALADRTRVQSIVRVRDRAHRPVGRALVLALDPAMEPLQKATADADGIASLAGLDGDGGLLAVSESGAHGLVLGIRLEGEHEVVLDDSALVAGVVLVDGQPAPDGLELELTTESPRLPANAPERLHEALDGASTRRSTRTRAGGVFAFEGLSPSWRGRLLPPSTHWRTDVESDMFGAAHRSLLLETPRRDVRLELTQLPTAMGRLVWDDTGEGIGDAQVTAHAKTDDGATAAGSCVTGPDGTFAVSLTPTTGGLQAAWSEPSKRPHLVSLRISSHEAPGSDGPSSVDVDATKAPEPVVLRVRRAKEQCFVAEDEDGQPIAGAMVDRDACTPSDETGRGTWRGGQAKFVGAPGRAVMPAHPITGDGSAPNPFRFVLPKDCCLEVVVRDLPDAARTTAQIVVESTTPVLAGGSKWPTRLHHRFGEDEWSGGRGPRTMADGTTLDVLHVSLRVPRDARAALHSLEPDTACEVRLEDALGRTLARTETRTPARGGTALVELAAGSSARQVSGRVLDENGSPLARAEVRIASGASSGHAFTTRDGRFAVLASGPAELRVRAMLTGYVMQEREVEPEAEAAELEFRLANGRTATVRVVDDEDEAVELYAFPLAFEFLQGQRLGPGVWQWSDLPPEVEFATTLQGKRWTVQCEAGQREAVLRVPKLATIVVTPNTLPDGRAIAREDSLVELRCVDAPELQVVRVGLGGQGEREAMVLPGRYTAEITTKARVANGAALESTPTGIQVQIALSAGERIELRFP